MIYPLDKFIVTASAFGDELTINWQLPITRPAVYKVYIFKRSRTDVTQLEIDSYFTHITNLTGYNYNGLFVYDNINNEVNALGDYSVLNDTKYYYKAVLRNETTGEYSTTKNANATPHPELKLSVIDGKDIVKTAIEKMLDNIYDRNGNRVQLGKDIQIVKSFAIEPVTENYFMIERINGSNYIQYWGNSYGYSGQNQFAMGSYDHDVIRATFITMDSPDRRDTVTKILRGMKFFLIRLVKALGAKDCSITIEGDYYNPQIDGLNAVGITLIFNLVVESKLTIPVERIDQVITELRVI